MDACVVLVTIDDASDRVRILQQIRFVGVVWSDLGEFVRYRVNGGRRLRIGGGGGGGGSLKP